MFQAPTAKTERTEVVLRVTGDLARLVVNLHRLCEESEGVTVNGLTFVRAKREEGFLAILRVDVGDARGDNDICHGFESGAYVVYAHGNTLLEALARMEADLQSGRAVLTPDKYADNTGVGAPKWRKKGRKVV